MFVKYKSLFNNYYLYFTPYTISFIKTIFGAISWKFLYQNFRQSILIEYFQHAAGVEESTVNPIHKIKQTNERNIALYSGGFDCWNK